MAERARIARYFAPLTASEPGSFNLTDDAAVLTPPAGQQLVITTDSVIETIHVLAGASPQQFAQKLMRRNLSDLAAMGATPWCYTLNLHTPVGLNDDWFAAFAAALATEQQTFGITLVGGDSTSGGDVIHTTMTCYGLLQGTALRRNGAKMDDDLYISGTIGGAALALAMLQQKQPIDAVLAAKYHCPEPRLTLGLKLIGIATSALDISDGLLADIQQLCTTSHVGARLERAAIPLLPELTVLVATDETAWRFALSGGDDYELCFTAPSSARAQLQTFATELNVPLTRIGEIIAGDKVIVLDEQGNELLITATGYEHR